MENHYCSCKLTRVRPLSDLTKEMSDPGDSRTGAAAAAAAEELAGGAMSGWGR